MIAIFGMIGAFWRRWFGGGFGKFGDITRAFKYAVLFFVVAGVLDWKDWRMYAVFLSFAIHWAIGHGDYFYVYDTREDERRIKCIDWCLRKLYGEKGYFNFKGNVTGLFLRYSGTACLVAVCLDNALFLSAGFLTALIYAVCGKLKKAIPVSEALAGAANFMLLYACI